MHGTGHTDDSEPAAVRDAARVEWALRERVQELTCLYGIAQVVDRSGEDLDAALGGIVVLLPPAWQFPEIAVAGITLDGRRWDAGAIEAAVSLQSADVASGGVPLVMAPSKKVPVPPLLPSPPVPRIMAPCNFLGL